MRRFRLLWSFYVFRDWRISRPSLVVHALIRVYLNAPLRATETGGHEVTDDFRLRSSMPMLTWLLERGVHVSVRSHLGQPKG
jgi:3-phosphoglycerate kinase